MTITTNTPIPHLPRLPLFGNLLDFRRRRLDFLRELTTRCGEISEVYFASWPVLVLNAPELAEVVLVRAADDFEKSPMLSRHLRPILGDGLLTIEMARHAEHRRRVAPAFQHRRLATYAQTMVQYTQQAQAVWSEGQIVDLTEAMQALTLRIVGTTLFGTDLLTQAASARDALLGIQQYANAVANAVIDIPFSWPLPRNRRAKRALAQIDATVDHILQERRSLPADQGDMLSVLLSGEATPSPSHLQYIRDEVRTIVLAGHETTAVALMWTWYLLTQHPVVYRQLQQEIDSAIGDRAPTVDDLAHVPTALPIIKEAMRLYPPVYAFARSAVRPVPLTSSVTIPAGRSVLISPYTLHRRPEYFPDPESFDPERWTPECEARLPRSAYLPFGAGPRGCIGQHFALLEAQLILITLAQQVTFAPVPGPAIGLDPLLTLRPDRHIALRVHRRARA